MGGAQIDLSVTNPAVLVGLFVGNKTEGTFGCGGESRLVAEHGSTAFGQIVPKFTGHVLFVENDHAVLTKENGSAQHALG